MLLQSSLPWSASVSCGKGAQSTGLPSSEIIPASSGGFSGAYSTTEFCPDKKVQGQGFSFILFLHLLSFGRKGELPKKN